MECGSSSSSSLSVLACMSLLSIVERNKFIKDIRQKDSAKHGDKADCSETEYLCVRYERHPIPIQAAMRS